LALHAEDSCVASERTQLPMQRFIHLFYQGGGRDQGQLEAQWDPRDTRHCHQRIAQRVMGIGVLIACLQQCRAHLLPGAKNPEGLVDF